MKIESAHQGADGAVIGIDCHEGRFDFRKLGDLPVGFVVLENADDGTAANSAGWCCLFVEQAQNRAQRLATQLNDIAASNVDLDLLGAGLENQGW